jgi:hypothetical protein
MNHAQTCFRGDDFRDLDRSLKAHIMANLFKQEAQFMVAWRILLPVTGIAVAIIAAMFLQPSNEHAWIGAKTRRVIVVPNQELDRWYRTLLDADVDVQREPRIFQRPENIPNEDA